MARRRIAKGEELLYSYGADYWKEKAERETEMARRGYSDVLWSTFLVSIMARRHVQKAAPAHRIHDLVQQYSAEGDEMGDYQRRYDLATLLGPSFFAS